MKFIHLSVKKMGKRYGQISKWIPVYGEVVTLGDLDPLIRFQCLDSDGKSKVGADKPQDTDGITERVICLHLPFNLTFAVAEYLASDVQMSLELHSVGIPTIQSILVGA